MFKECNYKKKITKAFYGFQVLYVFPFPRANHRPLGAGRDNVGIRLCLSHSSINRKEKVFYVFLHYCGIRLLNVGHVVIDSSALS